MKTEADGGNVSSQRSICDSDTIMQGIESGRLAPALITVKSRAIQCAAAATGAGRRTGRIIQ